MIRPIERQPPEFGSLPIKRLQFDVSILIRRAFWWLPSFLRTLVRPTLMSALSSMLLLAIATMMPTGVAAQDSGVTGLGYGPLDYELPAVASYELSRLGLAPDGQVISSNGEQTSLHKLYENKITLLSFMYSSCSDVNGCPLSAHVLHKIKSKMQEDSALADGLSLVSMSFDPAFDTPERLRLYEAGYRYSGSAGDWFFVTTESEQKLKPVLAAYRQDIDVINLAKENGPRDISHILRVYLIDSKKQIRNIYSVSFLHADILVNDVRTLLAELDGNSPAVSDNGVVTSNRLLANGLSRPGDGKDGYESASYETDSLALSTRMGRSADLIANASHPPLGLPPVPAPKSNPLSAAKVELGRKLFFDRRLSINGTFSCASCHVPEQGFAGNELETAVGVEGRTVRRNTMTIYNVAYAPRLFFDGREENLEQQVWNPLLARNEMANPSIGYVLKTIRTLDDYSGLFENAFDGRGPGMETVGMAIASYERTLVSANSPFDQWYFGKDESAVTEEVKKGFDLFTKKARCASCHVVGKDNALFSNFQMHNTGLGYRNSLAKKPVSKKVTLAPGLSVAIDSAIIDRVAEKVPADVGLYEVTEDPDDRWKFRTPSLRNVALTAPYMHNGQFQSLEEVVAFYNEGGVDHELLDPLMVPLELTDDEKSALVAFLKSLNGSNTDELVLDAFAAPIGDPQ